MATVRWRLDLAYDGAAYAGFALQPDRLTVVGDLREALARTLRLDEAPFLTGAGRTDAGVHASAQVISLDLDEAVLDDAGVPGLLKALNAQLRGRIALSQVRRVPEDFDARHSALWRRYRYLVSTASDLGPLNSLAWVVPGPLDLARMNDAASRLVGEHDFRAFCKRPADQSSEQPLTRRILSARWTPLSDEAVLAPGGDIVAFWVLAKAFCHHMVRRLVGAMVGVGQSRLEPGVLDERLLSASGEGLPSPAPVQGLSLIGVGYELRHGGDAGLPEG